MTTTTSMLPFIIICVFTLLVFVFIIKVISERDLLGTQLVKRNDALKLLYEKIKIQQSIMNKGDLHYNEREEDIRLLKLEIKKQRREKNILNKTASNVEDLR